MAAEVIHSGLVDVCWIVPCGPRKDKSIRTHILDRLTMAHLAVQSTFSANFPIYVHAIEYGRKEGKVNNNFQKDRALMNVIFLKIFLYSSFYFYNTSKTTFFFNNYDIGLLFFTTIYSFYYT